MTEQYKCGHCGGELYRLYCKEGKIITECINCKVQSVITVESILFVDWQEGEGRGVMCTGW